VTARFSKIVGAVFKQRLFSETSLVVVFKHFWSPGSSDLTSPIFIFGDFKKKVFTIK
jgi:hypothetical protein